MCCLSYTIKIWYSFPIHFSMLTLYHTAGHVLPFIHSQNMLFLSCSPENVNPFLHSWECHPFLILTNMLPFSQTAEHSYTFLRKWTYYSFPSQLSMLSLTYTAGHFNPFYTDVNSNPFWRMLTHSYNTVFMYIYEPSSSDAVVHVN